MRAVRSFGGTGPEREQSRAGHARRVRQLFRHKPVFFGLFTRSPAAENVGRGRLAEGEELGSKPSAPSLRAQGYSSFRETFPGFMAPAWRASLSSSSGWP